MLTKSHPGGRFLIILLAVTLTICIGLGVWVWQGSTLQQKENTATEQLKAEKIAQPEQLGLSFHNYEHTPPSGMWDKARVPFVRYQVTGEVDSTFTKMVELAQTQGWRTYPTCTSDTRWCGTRQTENNEQLVLQISKPDAQTGAQTSEHGASIQIDLRFL